MNLKVRYSRLVVAVVATLAPTLASADTTLPNVSYDVTRGLCEEYNGAFIKHWNEKTGETLTINQSHGGSSKQARAVADGVEADVITMSQVNDIDLLVERSKLRVQP